MNILYIPDKKPHTTYYDIGDIFTLSVQPDRLVDIRGIDIIVTDLTPITRELLSRSDAKIVATLTTGTDHIDTNYLKENGIRLVTLLDCPKYVQITGTAEHALGLMLALARNYKRAFAYPEDGRDSLRGHELSGKTLGIIGLGRLGMKMRSFAWALGMDVIWNDSLKKGHDFEYVIQASDFLSIHAPGNEKTRGMISYETLSMMKSTAYLINTARGELIQDGALLKALESGTIAGAASDFYDDELLAYSKTHDNLILTPHLGGATVEGLEKADALIAGKLKEILHEQSKENKNEGKEKA